VISLKTLDNLIHALNEDETIIMYRKLEAIIDKNPDYKAAYTDILDKQQAMVRAIARQDKDRKRYENIYEDALEALKNHPAVIQYLNLQAEVNQKMQLLFSIIENDLNEKRNVE